MSFFQGNDFSPNLTVLQIFDRANVLSSITQDIYKNPAIPNSTLIKIACILNHKNS